MSGVTLLPGATLGVVGGGQLGRMFVHAAQAMGYETAVLDPDPASPAGRVAHHHVHAEYLDVQSLRRLADLSDAVTTEFENVPARSLTLLSELVSVAPAADAVSICQDRAAEKAQFARSGVRCAPHAVIEHDEQVQAVAEELMPGILKTARLGYDGKGQAIVTSRSELAAAGATDTSSPSSASDRAGTFSNSVVTASLRSASRRRLWASRYSAWT